ncbi:MAG: hypothetical protein AB7V13_08345 [Pseudorhodoplanes sp.]|uniref:hypothetical protein n=1 Tax=Pseudorhodoplanes sp. TaxID=1934341 RepID=UPI003D0D5B59
MSLHPSFVPFVVDKPRADWPCFSDPDSPLLKVLCFADEAEMGTVFASAGIVAPAGDTLEGEESLQARFSWPGIGDVEVIGPAVDTEAELQVIDDEVQEVTPATFLPGWYVNVLVPEPQPEPAAPATLTPEQFQRAIERHVDSVAAQRGYSSAVSLASYVASSVPQWAAEAEVFVAWRDAVWVYALAELAKVMAAERSAPETAEAFITELPSIAWP